MKALIKITTKTTESDLALAPHCEISLMWHIYHLGVDSYPILCSQVTVQTTKPNHILKPNLASTLH